MSPAIVRRYCLNTDDTGAFRYHAKRDVHAAIGAMKPFAEVGSPLRGRLWLASPQVVPTQFIASASIALVITRRAMGFFNMTSLGAVAIGALLLRWMTDVLGTRDAARVRASAAIASGVVVHI
ncbi:MAG: hypothetical protein AB7U39_17865, partial [Ilumatobacteraceae bacterium]